MEELELIKQKIAYKVWQDTKCLDPERNWDKACDILNHFLDRHPEDEVWRLEEMCWEKFKEIIYGQA